MMASYGLMALSTPMTAVTMEERRCSTTERVMGSTGRGMAVLRTLRPRPNG
jgi:hypothetical protein